jgi:hypothetical protein
MSENNPTGLTTRRSFLQYLAMLAVGGKTLARSRDARAAADAAVNAVDPPSGWPAIPRRTLGRTGFEASRLVFGCGAALSRHPNEPLLNAAFEAGINVFDVGSSTFYADAERNLAPFLKKHRDEIFLISKAMVGLNVEPSDDVSVAQTRQAAATWSERLDESLRQLQVERVDAYYVMASNHPTIIGSEEIHAAFEKAKQAGKVTHLGLSTHQNAEKVLETAMDRGWYSLAMTAITPGGWYSWADKGLLDDGKAMTDLEPFLARVRASGIGLVGMKAGRYLAGRKYFGWSDPDAFDEYYGEKAMAEKLSAWQRSYAYVLAHGMDIVNADMQSMAHLKENVVAVANSDRVFA